ncbi:hypothetical protein Q3G72_018040 [Acer saccharum]|nr:hypothetical protein Q3G72_018040 [Acer saccharum]
MPCVCVPSLHGTAIVDGPPDVELHGPSDVNWADNVVHARVNKEASNKDNGKHVLKKGQGEGEPESEAEGQAEVEVDDQGEGEAEGEAEGQVEG